MQSFPSALYRKLMSANQARTRTAKEAKLAASPRKLSDAEAALLDEIALLAQGSRPQVAIKDLELRLEYRGFSEAQVRRALMSLLRRGQLEFLGGRGVAPTQAEGRNSTRRASATGR